VPLSPLHPCTSGDRCDSRGPCAIGTPDQLSEQDSLRLQTAMDPQVCVESAPSARSDDFGRSRERSLSSVLGLANALQEVLTTMPTEKNLYGDLRKKIASKAPTRQTTRTRTRSPKYSIGICSSS